VQYETIMGSAAYGVSSDVSDCDIYGWAIPPIEHVFPHLAGQITGFGRQIDAFEQFQQHHIHDAERTYDLTIFSIVKLFRLAMENNPNILDSLFTPESCVVHCTRVGRLVRDNRRVFLHRGVWPKFKGYATAQLHKLTIKEPQGKRAELVARHGYDTKFAYHVVRLLCEAEQLLLEGDLDLARHRDLLRAIRQGEWSEAQLRAWAAAQEHKLEAAYAKTVLPPEPREAELKELLLDCLEEHYGSLPTGIRG
jgi:predicted nucleotidyltransferase